MMSTSNAPARPAEPHARIVVVEDERTIARTISDRLSAEGWAVAIAHDGPSGVATIENFKPDAVVLDVMLPGFDGLEVCRRVRGLGEFLSLIHI